MKKRKHTWNQWRRNKLENYMAAPQAWALPSPLHCLQSGQGQHKRTVRGGLQWTRSILCRQYVPLHKTSQNQEAVQIQRKYLQRKCNLQISQVQSLFKSMVGLDVESYSKVNLSSWTNLDPDQTDPACSLGKRSSWRRQLFCLIRNSQGFERNNEWDRR